MTACIQIVETAPVVGRENEFDRWYDDIHLPEVLAMTGFAAGQRFAPSGPGAEDQSRCLTVYEIETDDLAATLESLATAAPTLTPIKAMNAQQTVGAIFRAHGERRTSESGTVGSGI